MANFLMVHFIVELFSGSFARLDGMTGEEELDAVDDHVHLAYYPPRIHHTYGCVDSGIWNGSCDIDLTTSNTDTMETPSVVSVTDWSERCDPWKGVRETMTTVYSRADAVWVDIHDGTTVKSGWTAGNWTCPHKYRSMSGCGDFRADTRSLTPKCAQNISLSKCGRPYDRRIYRENDIRGMFVPQRHACNQHPIFYDNLGQFATSVLPPPVGRHRERWAKWGEYEYLPPQRWLHNNEHGGAIFLYHQCLDQDSLCQLRRYIQKWQKRIGSIPWKNKGKDDEDTFRFILTPFKDLAQPIAIVSWGQVYSSKCMNEHDMDYFLEKTYRTAYEDWPPNGPYDYLWKDINETAASCPKLQDAGEEVSSQLLTAQQKEVLELRAIVNDLKAQEKGNASAEQEKAQEKEILELRALVSTLTGTVKQLQSEMAGIKDVCKVKSNGRLLEGAEPCDDSTGDVSTTGVTTDDVPTTRAATGDDSTTGAATGDDSDPQSTTDRKSVV